MITISLGSIVLVSKSEIQTVAILEVDLTWVSAVGLGEWSALVLSDPLTKFVGLSALTSPAFGWSVAALLLWLVLWLMGPQFFPPPPAALPLSSLPNAFVATLAVSVRHISFWDSLPSGHAFDIYFLQLSFKTSQQFHDHGLASFKDHDFLSN